MIEGDEETRIDKLPIDLLAQIFSLFTSFKDLAQASSACRKWNLGAKESLAWRETLSCSGWKMDDESTTRLVLLAYNLKELDISRSRWGCQITDYGLKQLSNAKCISNLSSVSMWGSTAITDKGVVHLISRAASLEHLNVGGTCITDATLFAVADSCPRLKTIVLWSCRHVTGDGLLAIVKKCCKLESINVWGMKIPLDCFIGLLTVSPTLQIQPKETLLNDESVHAWPTVY
ncbi:hypothetical protein CASFOL_011479 [Castilleja foliolosa]|uniref:F-box domain-containing protein n=1 Tax=Castilleja foliolosa TaxID=1961234 RepID=A0ABD3DZS2_9LAMI